MDDLDAFRKKLIYRSWHRGTREMDLILGSFAEKIVPNLKSEELNAFEELLSIGDPELYDWYTGRKLPEHKTPLIESFLEHKVNDDRHKSESHQ